MAIGGAFTAHAATTAPDAPDEAQELHKSSPATSTSKGKHAKPYVSGSETPREAKPGTPSEGSK
ncbi:hypothetical protein ABTX35_00205, partial [Streptomyces sp. NPDC096080]